jgi:dUTP pyrophosphatase
VSNWALGWIAVKGFSFSLPLFLSDVALKLKEFLSADLTLEKNSVLVRIKEFPVEPEPEISFLRGVFEAGGEWGTNFGTVPRLKEWEEVLDALVGEFRPEKTDREYLIKDKDWEFFLFSLYDRETVERSEHFYQKFLSLISGGSQNFPVVFEYQLEEGAIPPFKKHASDTGWDLHLIKLVEKKGNLYLFDTGVRVSPPKGYYFDLVPRSSIYKSGFIMANSVGIIDMSYRGTVKAPLIKVVPDAKDPELPWRAVQLVLRKFHYAEGIEVKSLSRTKRGEGGFGSTG